MTTNRQTQTRTIEDLGYALEDLDIAPRVMTTLANMEAARQDSRSLTPEDRAAYVAEICRALKLNPLTRPVQFLSLQNREVLYLTRGATDQLAARHGLNRETLEGPDFRVLEGVKVAFCKVKATLPSGRFEVSTATLKVTSPADDLMKVETKSKRRATLSILGIGVLSEEEAESVAATERATDRRETQRPEEPRAETRPAPDNVPTSLPRDNGLSPSQSAAPKNDLPPEHEAALEEFYARVAEIELPGEAIAVWMKHRAALSVIVPRERENAWKALCSRVEEVGQMKNAKVWLKKAIAEEDARRMEAESHPDPDDDGGPTKPRRGPRKAPQGEGAADAPAASQGATTTAQDGTTAIDRSGARASNGASLESRAARRGYLATLTYAPAIRTTAQRRGDLPGYVEDCAARLCALDPSLSMGDAMAYLATPAATQRRAA